MSVWSKIHNVERHEPDCTKPEPSHMTMKHGDSLVHCWGCMTRWIVPKPEPVILQVQVERRVPMSGFACASHMRPVTWRGAGCSDCIAEQAQSRAKRQAKRRRQPQPRPYEELM
jgi:hypothetical protein